MNQRFYVPDIRILPSRISHIVRFLNPIHISNNDCENKLFGFNIGLFGDTSQVFFGWKLNNHNKIDIYAVTINGADTYHKFICCIGVNKNYKMTITFYSDICKFTIFVGPTKKHIIQAEVAHGFALFNQALREINLCR